MLGLYLGTTYLLGATLTIEISNVETKEGKLYVGLYTENQEFLNIDRAFMKKIIEAKNDTEELTFDNLEEGSYAVAIFHDINNNGMLDKNFIGFPKEPYAFSNNFKPKFSKPEFDDCNFTVENEDIKQMIVLSD